MIDWSSIPDGDARNVDAGAYKCPDAAGRVATEGASAVCALRTTGTGPIVGESTSERYWAGLHEYLTVLRPTWGPELTYAGSQCPPDYTPAWLLFRRHQLFNGTDKQQQQQQQKQQELPANYAALLGGFCSPVELLPVEGLAELSDQRARPCDEAGNKHETGPARAARIMIVISPLSSKIWRRRRASLVEAGRLRTSILLSGGGA